ncbi:hypothetical protein SDRG_02392 [Saprolegnia diclina VS20]|uniref:Uncharacterized protein n=1 Tax=Saprolegnia diclina (strain VS20) TaxID=1156394 RepID=T0R0P4_SAPDV|nr:hypothetical protein SDRG_02392 [Saprolegnia diclina VS20]EQC40501.1 hypothetical protein SDRG_02392 [Saprolegnia diclina VS20]|eukprot:XP_008606200.1 hypothetical protein SDRG_02392 [Saprolegnia diclina VS20]
MTFLRSTAVSSIFGYFLDVGDRHMGNILLNVKSGKCVHIDFECIFGRARHLPVPERVPFRLTRNICDALSAINDFDAFRTTCGAVLRNHRAVLRCHVDMFVRTDASLAPNVVAILQALDKRLAGATMAENADVTKSSEDIARDVESQVESLVDDAMSIDNLMRMYLGWSAPF